MQPRIMDRHVQNGLRRAVLTARRATERVSAARDLEELVRVGDVEVDPLVRLMACGLPELQELEIAVRTRAVQIVGSQLSRLERVLETHGLNEFEAYLIRLRREHWGFLNGPRAPLRSAVEAHVSRLKDRAYTQ